MREPTPRWCSPSASARPPIPAPTIAMSGFIVAGHSSTQWIDRPFALRALCFERNARRAVEFADKLFQQTKEHRLFLCGEWRQDFRLCASRRLGEPFEHRFGCAGEGKVAPPPIRSNDATDEASLFQFSQHHSRGRTIEAEQLGQGDLIYPRP